VAFTEREVEVTANHEMDTRTYGFAYEAEYRDYLVCIVTPWRSCRASGGMNAERRQQTNLAIHLGTDHPALIARHS
jgi:hypothetical protein